MKRISDIKKIERCEKLLWLSKRQPYPFTAFIYYNEDIYALSKRKLRIEDWLQGRTGDDNSAFFDNEEKYTAFAKMRFTFEGLRVRIPIMVRKGKKYHVYFLFAHCYPKESEAQSMADQLWVLKNLGIHVSKVYAIHLNHKYVRAGALDVNRMLKISGCLYNDKNREGQRITGLLARRDRSLLPILKRIDETLAKSAVEKTRTNICTRRNKCPYFETCFPTPNKDTSILNLVSCGHKFSLLDAGKCDIADVEMDDIEGTRHQFAQIMAAKEESLFFDVFAVERFFESQIQYPISYLDFEWETYAYPPFTGMKPFDVLTFQYSLHIEESDHSLAHKEYLGKQDCRLEFVERLLADIPAKGSVMCFNVEGAEKLRLTQLAAQFPQYEEQLRSVWERMVDLSIPFSTGLIYDNRMAGMYSLKKLVSIFTDYNYADLDISHGVDAVRHYRLLAHEDTQEQEKTKKELLAYCAMDTYAEVLIYHWISDNIKTIKKARLSL